MNFIAPPGFEPGSSVPKTDRIGHYPTGLNFKKNKMRPPGFEPGLSAWKAEVLPD